MSVPMLMSHQEQVMAGSQLLDPLGNGLEKAAALDGLACRG